MMNNKTIQSIIEEMERYATNHWAERCADDIRKWANRLKNATKKS